MAYMERGRLERLLETIGGARVALLGDLCLDAYWTADMRLSELSRETPHHPLPVVEERYSPGGAGNVACNIAALRPRALAVLGAVGVDWRGEQLLAALAAAGVDTARILRAPEITTNAYIKPVRTGISHVAYEDPRIDFENRAPLPDALNRRLLAALEDARDDFDVLLVSDQMRFGCVTPELRARVCALGREGRTVVVDSRDRIGDYRHVIVKPNEVEAARAFGGDARDPEALKPLAAAIAARNGAPAVVTLGEQGCLVADGAAVSRVPARPVDPPVDIVGAGDTFLAALGCALGGGAALEDAARLACLASSVTIRKLGVTGTASREELLRHNG